MKLRSRRLVNLPVWVLISASIALGQTDGLSKRDYYNTRVAPVKKRPSLLRIFGFEDRKRSVLDIGNLVVRFSNAATLGYDRWGLNHEFPSGSMAKAQCCTYYWTLSPIVGGLVKGQPSVATGVRGSLRDSEEEWEPLPGYDAGIVDDQSNIGIAFSDKPGSWPDAWPIETDPTGTYTDPVTGLSWPGIEAPLDLDHPEGSGLRFPGVLDGLVAGKREAYFVVTDNDPLEGNTLESNGVGPLNIRVDMWALQYDDNLNQDFVIWWERFTNVGPDTLREVFVGLNGDPDTPEQGGAEWTDDYSVFIERGDPLMFEKIGVADQPLLWDLAIIYDGDDQSEGFISSGVGWNGLKALKTPYSQTADGLDNDGDGEVDEGFDGVDNDADGDIDEEDEQEELGVTNYFAFPYDLDAQSDNEAYYIHIRGGFGKEDPGTTGYQEAPHTDDTEQKPYAYGPDVTVVMTSGPITLAPGESVDFVFADILGVNETDLLNNALTAQLLFDAAFKAPAPPDEPVVNGVAGDGEITLYWDTYPSEYSVDPFTGNNAFEGYRIYKSTDRGATWGDPITDGKGNTVFYKPEAIYDLEDDWSGVIAYGSPAAYYDLGNNSSLQYSYTDQNVINGLEYWYAVSAFDHTDGIIPPLENPPKKSRSDAAASGNNTVILIPESRPTDFDAGMIEVKQLTGRSTADVHYTIYDAARLDGYNYSITINDDFDDTDDTTKSYSVLNENLFTVTRQIAVTGTGLPHRNILESSVVVTDPDDGEYQEGVDFTVDTEEGEIFSTEEGALAKLKEVSFAVSYKYYPIFESTLLSGETYNPSFEGMRFMVTDQEDVLQDDESTYWSNPQNEDSVATTNWNVVASPISTPGNPDDYEIRFEGSTPLVAPQGAEIPLELWNVSATPDTFRFDQLIVSPTPVGGVITSGTEIRIIEVPNGETTPAITWGFTLMAPDPVAESSDISVTVLCDTTQPGNGIYDEGEHFTDLDSDTTWDEGEPFVDCYFDSVFAVSELNAGISAMIPRLADSVAAYCDSPDIDTTITDTVVDVFQYDLETFTFDTIPGLRMTANVSALCDTSIDPETGDRVLVGTTKPLSVDDSYLIQSSASQSVLNTQGQLEEVKVVPNPYVVTSVYETNIETKEVQFHYLPERCTIRIFTLAGELLKVIEHKEGSEGWRGPSIEAWNLRTYNNQEVAFGIYIFNVEAEGVDSSGNPKTFSEVGKLAIIR
ncbi:MAG: hypothetical protein V3U24_11685 [Candidatus Neomarinimicrobiota bacterium]